MTDAATPASELRHLASAAGRSYRRHICASTCAADILRNQMNLEFMVPWSSSRNRGPHGRARVSIRHRGGDAGQACRHDADASKRAADILRNQMHMESAGAQITSRDREPLGRALARIRHRSGDAGQACRQDTDAFKGAADTLHNHVYLEFLGTQSCFRNDDPLGRALCAFVIGAAAWGRHVMERLLHQGVQPTLCATMYIWRS